MSKELDTKPFVNKDPYGIKRFISGGIGGIYSIYNSIFTLSIEMLINRVCRNVFGSGWSTI